MNSKITVCLAADKNYIQHLMVTMVSVLLSTDLNRVLDFIIFSDGSLDETDLECLKKHRSFELRVINAAELISKYITIDSDQVWPLATYYRLLLPFICHDEQKVLYLDCDIVVMKSIHELWDAPFENYSIAGVADTGCPHKERLLAEDIEIKGNYFNAGVSLWNLSRIRSNGYEEKLKDAAARLRIPAYADQCWLNIMFNEDKVILPIRWNVMSHEFNISTKSSGTYTKEDVGKALADPSICHFSGIKPWTMTYTEHPYWFEYWCMLKHTPYFYKGWRGHFKKAFLSSEDAFLLRVVRPVVKRMLNS